MKMNAKDLEALWNEIASAVEEASLRAFPATIHQATSIARWPDGEPFTDFLSHASAQGATLLYIDKAVFDEDALAELQRRVSEAEDSPNYQSARRTIEQLEPPITFPELEAFVSKARAFLGRISAIEVQWVHASVVHSYLRLATWYSDFLDEIQALKAQATEIEVNRDSEALSRHEAELDRLARALASTTEFKRSKKTLAAIRRLASKAHPEATLSDLQSVARSALEVYETEILPEEERRLAQEGRSLIEAGDSLTRASAKLGMSSGRLQRLLARYEE